MMNAGHGQDRFISKPNMVVFLGAVNIVQHTDSLFFQRRAPYQKDCLFVIIATIGFVLILTIYFLELPMTITMI